MHAENCFDVTTYENMLAGQLPVAEAEKVCAHLEKCDRCSQVVRSLPSLPEDTLVASLRAQGAWPNTSVEPKFIQDLIQKVLKQNHPEETLPPRDVRSLELREAPTLPPDGSHIPQGGSLAAEKSGSLADPPAGRVLDDDGPLPSIPGYEVLGVLGRGGMGVVYKARHLKLNRLVALKMILAGSHAGARELARFQVEAEAIARLQHPNIVQVYEIGEHEGKPFFSLEFCGGGSLAQKLSGTPLPAHQAAALVETLARAMQAAHDRNIIHRDLKPGNILLASGGRKPPDGAPATENAHESGGLRPPLAIPKITDFGLAKKLDEAGQTKAGAIMGTPSYMAPEQAGGDSSAVGPLADVYALGAILYECLTGRPPFMAASSLETIVQVTHDEPVPPSQLQSKTPKDLETICLKCLQKSPAKRFASATHLADDLGRFLRGEPVLARPVGRVARVWRWCRRSPALAAASAAAVLGAFLALATFGVAFLWVVQSRNDAVDAADKEFTQRVRAEGLAEQNDLLAKKENEGRLIAERATQKALAAADAESKAKATAQRLAEDYKRATEKALAAADAESKAKATAEKRLVLVEKGVAIIASIFKDIDPRAPEKGGPHLLEQLAATLEKTADTLNRDLSDDPKTLGRLQGILGDTLTNLGHAKKGIEILAKAHAAMEASFGPDHPDTLSALANLAHGYQADGRSDKALPMYEEVLAKRKARHGPDHPDTLNSLNNLATAYQAAGLWAKAIPLFEENLAKVRISLGPDHPGTMTSMSNLAITYLYAGQVAKALPLSEETLARRKAVLGPEHPDTLLSMNSLAGAYLANNQIGKALPLFEETLAKLRTALGPDHPSTLNSMANLAAVYGKAGQLAKSATLYEETLAKKRIKLGSDHPSTLYTMENTANVYQAVGQLGKALPLHEEALARRRAKLGPDHPDTLTSTQNLAALYLHTRNASKAIPLYEELVKGNRKQLGPGDQRLAVFLAPIAADLLRYDQPAAAEPILRECVDIQSKTQPNSWTTFNMMSVLGGALLKQKKFADAEPLLKEGYEGLKQRENMSPQARPRVAQALDRLVQLCDATGKTDEAARWRKELAARQGK